MVSRSGIKFSVSEHAIMRGDKGKLAMTLPLLVINHQTHLRAARMDDQRYTMNPSG